MPLEDGENGHLIRPWIAAGVAIVLASGLVACNQRPDTSGSLQTASAEQGSPQGRELGPFPDRIVFSALTPIRSLQEQETFPPDSNDPSLTDSYRKLFHAYFEHFDTRISQEGQAQLQWVMRTLEYGSVPESRYDPKGLPPYAQAVLMAAQTRSEEWLTKAVDMIADRADQASAEEIMALVWYLTQRTNLDTRVLNTLAWIGDPTDRIDATAAPTIAVRDGLSRILPSDIPPPRLFFTPVETNPSSYSASRFDFYNVQQDLTEKWNILQVKLEEERKTPTAPDISFSSYQQGLFVSSLDQHDIAGSWRLQDVKPSADGTMVIAGIRPPWLDSVARVEIPVPEGDAAVVAASLDNAEVGTAWDVNLAGTLRLLAVWIRQDGAVAFARVNWDSKQSLTPDAFAKMHQEQTQASMEATEWARERSDQIRAAQEQEHRLEGWLLPAGSVACTTMFDAVNVGMMGTDELRRAIVVNNSKCIFAPNTTRVRVLRSMEMNNVPVELVQSFDGSGPSFYVISFSLR